MDLERYTASSRVTGLYGHNQVCQSNCFLCQIMSFCGVQPASVLCFCNRPIVFWAVTMFQCIRAVVAVLAVVVIARTDNQEKISLMFGKRLTRQVSKMGSKWGKNQLNTIAILFIQTKDHVNSRKHTVEVFPHLSVNLFDF